MQTKYYPIRESTLSSDSMYQSLIYQNDSLRRLIDLLAKHYAGHSLTAVERTYVDAALKARYGEPKNGGNGK